MRRKFNKSEKTALYILSDGKCEICGIDLKKGWHADHVKPYSKGGDTEIVNAQALCPECNLKKGDNMITLRSWQKECFHDWKSKLDTEGNKDNYLISATPGSGKTIIALTIVKYCFDNDIAERVVVVVPTDHLKYQWSNDASEDPFQIEIEPNNFKETKGFDGTALTYHAVNSNKYIQEKLCSDNKTIVIFDEIHHAGDDKAWGESIQSAFKYATKRILLSGTPFRSDNCKIPFVEYNELDNGLYESKNDFSITYGQGIKQGILKKIYFNHINGEVSFDKGDSSYENISLSDNDDLIQLKKRAAYRLNGKNDADSWLCKTLLQANSKLESIRNSEDGRKDAAGIIFVTDINTAKCYETNDTIHEALGCTPVVVYHEKNNSKELIENFKTEKSRWIICVNQISEGVDIKRLCIGIYASNESTKLIFRQRFGRIIRIDSSYKSCSDAYFYLPATPDLKELSSEIEEEIGHIIFCDEMDDTLKESKDGNKFIDDFISFETKNVRMESVIVNGIEYTAPKDIIDELREKYDTEIIKTEHIYIMAQEIYKERLKNKETENIEKVKNEPKYHTRENKRSHLNRYISRLVYILHKKDNMETGEIKKEINGNLYRFIGNKKRKDLSIEELDKCMNFIKECIDDER